MCQCSSNIHCQFSIHRCSYDENINIIHIITHIIASKLHRTVLRSSILLRMADATDLTRQVFSRSCVATDFGLKQV